MGGIDFSSLMGAKFCDEWDTLCKKCGNLQSECECKKAYEIKERSDFFLWVNKEKRKGREVTLCGEFFLTKEEVREIFKKIKKILACGGALKEGERGFIMEFQGDFVQKVKEILKKENFKFKR